MICAHSLLEIKKIKLPYTERNIIDKHVRNVVTLLKEPFKFYHRPLFAFVELP
jgi:hypothetical protein